MPPFIVPTITPAQQATMMSNREVDLLVAKLTARRRGPFDRDLVALCDKKGRRGSQAWMDLARKLAGVARKPKHHHAPRKPKAPKPQPAPMVLVVKFRAHPRSRSLAEVLNSVLYLGDEDAAAGIYLDDLFEAEAAAELSYADDMPGWGTAVDLGGRDDPDDQRNDEWVDHGFHLTARPCGCWS